MKHTAIAFSAAAAIASAMPAAAQMKVHASQVGYWKNGPRRVMVVNPTSDKFELESQGKVVYKGTISKPKLWKDSGEEVAWLDFSAYNAPESQTLNLKIGGEVVSTLDLYTDGNKMPNDRYNKLAYDAHRAFYMWRCSEALPKELVGEYARAAGHPDTDVLIHPSAESASRKAGSSVSSPGGWYDAGDYGKYTTNAAVSLESLLTGYEAYYDFYAHNWSVKSPSSENGWKLDIPESSNGEIDILDECMVELKWMLTMQDPEDGSVALKLTTLRFAPFVMPEKATAQRYLIGRSTDAALTFAAIMAKSARIYKDSKAYAGFSEKALAAARKAFDWAVANPALFFRNPEGVNTGQYSMRGYKDNFLLAATELFITTNESKYLEYIDIKGTDFIVPSWQEEQTYALMSLLVHSQNVQSKSLDTELIVSTYRKLADRLISTMDKSLGYIPVESFRWGSNGDIANAGAVLMLAYRYLGDTKYRDAALQIVYYLTGCNATGYCFITGSGSKHPVHMHDRRSTADGIDAPLPGLIVGGPNNEATGDYDAYPYGDKTGFSYYPTTKYPARCYVDEMYSYSTNEVAINWNAPLCALLAGYEWLVKCEAK